MAESSAILEVAYLQVKAGQGDAFEDAFREAQPIIASMPGYRSHELQECLEHAGHYLLLVRWDSVDAHEEGFRKSERYPEWKRLLHHFYDPFPTVLHYQRICGTRGLPRAFPGGTLRRLRASDVGDFQAYRGNPEAGRFQGWERMSDAEARAFLEEMASAYLFPAGEWMQVGIADARDDRLIGDIGILLEADGRRAQLGFTLDPAAQGRGLGTAAVREVVTLVRELTNVREIVATTDSRNVRSMRLLERAGFKREETHDAVFRGEPCIEHVYVLHADA
jgi:ribosomal-protein-alanine N-acetyltransferase